MITKPFPGTCDGRREPGLTQPGCGRCIWGLDVHERWMVFDRRHQHSLGQCLDYCPSWPVSSYSVLFFFLCLWNLFPHSLQIFTVCSQCVTGQVWCLCTKLMEASTKFSSFATSEKLSTLTWPVSLLLGQMATLSLPSSFFSSCESCCPPRPHDATTKSSLLS